MKSISYAAVSVLLAALLGSPAAFSADPPVTAPTATAPEPTAEPTPDETPFEVEVTGEQPGPALWKVTNGDNVLWIFGTLRPLPNKMQWQSRAVERVLDTANLVVQSGVDVKVDAGPFALVGLYFSARKAAKDPDGQPLKTRLPAPLYARFAALKERYARRDGSMEKRRPVVAAREIYEAALEANKLTSDLDVEERLVKLARKRKVKVVQAEMTIEDPKGLLAEISAMPLSAEIGCMDATVTRLETDVPNMRARAAAWALGDVEALRALPIPQDEDACMKVLDHSPRLIELRDRGRALWYAKVVEALRTQKVTVATSSISRLLSNGGLLAHLKAQGFQVESP